MHTLTLEIYLPPKILRTFPPLAVYTYKQPNNVNLVMESKNVIRWPVEQIQPRLLGNTFLTVIGRKMTCCYPILRHINRRFWRPWSLDELRSIWGNYHRQRKSVSSRLFNQVIVSNFVHRIRTPALTPCIQWNGRTFSLPTQGRTHQHRNPAHGSALNFLNGQGWWHWLASRDCLTLWDFLENFTHQATCYNRPCDEHPDRTSKYSQV